MQNPDEVARKLRRLHQELKAQSPYEIFDLWEGCGRELVQQTFYRLVKEHHPDSYGGNLSEEVKRLAQDNFLRVKDAYGKLRMAEGEQTVAQRPAQAADRVALRAEGSGLDREMSGPISMPPRQDGYQTPAPTAPIGGRPLMHTQPPKADSPPAPTAPSVATAQAQAAPAREPGRQPMRSAMPTPALTPSAPRAEPGSTSTSTSTEAESEERAKAMERLRAASRRPVEAYGLTPHGGQPPQPSGPSEQERRALLEQLSGKRPAPPPPRPEGAPTLAPGKPVPADQAAKLSQADEAQTSFNQGYQEYKLKRMDKALPLFKRAYDLDPKNGLYMTFYAQLLYMSDPTKRDTAEKLLRDAVLTKHRQALPDAHLFLGLLLKTKEGGMAEAIRHFRNAHYLNPGSREAEREIRLYERRQEQEASQPESAGATLKKLFKK